MKQLLFMLIISNIWIFFKREDTQRQKL